MWRIIIFLVLSGCSMTPIAGYEHFSDPWVKGDGYDLFCAGVSTDLGHGFEAQFQPCYNAAPNHGRFVKANVQWRMGHRISLDD